MATPPYGNLNFLAWPAGHGLDWHGHKEFQIIHVLEGSLEIDHGQGWRLHRTGDAHILPPGMQHRTRTDRGHRQLGLNFTTDDDPRGIIAMLRHAFPTPTTVHLEPDSFSLAGIKAHANGLLPSSELKRPTGASLGSQGRADVLLTRANLRLYAVLDMYCLALVDAADANQGGCLAQRLLEHLQANVDQPLSVAEVVEALQVSRATLQRASKTAFACGISHLHERLRITLAARLLLDSDLSISACATQVGYPDVYQFSRAFRRVMFLPPTKYRRKYRSLTA